MSGIEKRSYTGIVFSATDGDPVVPPEETPLTSTSAYDWFETFPEHLSHPQIKLLTHKIDQTDLQDGFQIPFSKAIIDESFWNPTVYTSFSTMQCGGCAALTDSPYRMILQTPIDGLPFASLAMRQQGRVCKGIWTFSDSSLEPIPMMVGERLYSGWVHDAVQITSLPQAFLRTHIVWMSKQLSDTLRQLQQVELALNEPYIDDFSSIQRTLHRCQESALTLERRAEFENVIITAIESVIAKLGHNKYGTIEALAPAKSAMQLRRADLDIIPKRIESARIAINDRILQRAQLQGLQIAQATHQIAQATMHDSASMKTIAILTMIFLPGTAVASFFSMNLWNWESASADGLVSPWLWVYFVVAVPLTVGVVMIWSIWSKIKKRQLRSLLPITTQPAPPYLQNVKAE